MLTILYVFSSFFLSFLSAIDYLLFLRFCCCLQLHGSHTHTLDSFNTADTSLVKCHRFFPLTSGLFAYFCRLFSATLRAKRLVAVSPNLDFRFSLQKKASYESISLKNENPSFFLEKQKNNSHTLKITFI